MGIVRLITVAAVIWVLWFLYKRFELTMAERKAERKNKEIRKERVVSNVKKCEYCEVHILENEAFESEGVFFCSKSHLKSYNADK